MDHDQNFKNLILEYPRQALKFFAQEEIGEHDLVDARIIPIREEQLKSKLGERYRKLDVPLLIEWPDGQRERILFILEEETLIRRFSIYRLAHYCLDLSELMETTRVVPVVIFLGTGNKCLAHLQLGSNRQTYLDFRYLFCYLKKLNAADYMESNNIVARLNLPNMHYAATSRLSIYAAAQKGLAILETNPRMQIKYADFIDAYAALSEEEMQQYQKSYVATDEVIMGLAQILRQEGLDQGIEQGLEQGLEQGRQQECINLISRLLRRKLGIHPEVETILETLTNLSLETLESMTDVLLDFNEVQDLKEWISQQQN